jgi:hypothetical protein
VSQFVEECRREWKRLRVPDLVADEMAADLAADLEEAEAEGVAAVEVLGGAASDPRSFAATWAAERGVIPPAPLTARIPRSALVPVAIAALTIVAAVGAALVIFASPHATPPIATVPFPPPPHPARTVAAGEIWVVPVNVHGRFLVPPAQARAAGVDIHKVGSILLIAGIIGVILSTPLLFWSSSRRFKTAQP